MDLLEMYQEILHEPGTKVICYICESYIYDIDEVPLGGTMIRSSLFKPARPDIPAPKPGDRVRCPVCGGNFLSPDNELLTEPHKRG